MRGPLPRRKFYNTGYTYFLCVVVPIWCSFLTTLAEKRGNKKQKHREGILNTPTRALPPLQWIALIFHVQLFWMCKNKKIYILNGAIPLSFPGMCTFFCIFMDAMSCMHARIWKIFSWYSRSCGGFSFFPIRSLPKIAVDIYTQRKDIQIEEDPVFHGKSPGILCWFLFTTYFFSKERKKGWKKKANKLYFFPFSFPSPLPRTGFHSDCVPLFLQVASFSHSENIIQRKEKKIKM